MARAFLAIDVQNDFCEGGSLACDGGAAVASAITDYLKTNGDKYDFVIASRDWHDANSTNSGHFAEPGHEPDMVTTWPVHCVAGSPGADYHPNFDTDLIDIHVQKGQGIVAYSMFEGSTPDGKPIAELIQELGIDSVDVGGIATDYCVLASSLDANSAGIKVNVFKDLTTGVAEETSAQALSKLIAAGCTVTAAN